MTKGFGDLLRSARSGGSAWTLEHVAGKPPPPVSLRLTLEVEERANRLAEVVVVLHAEAAEGFACSGPRSRNQWQFALRSYA